MNIKILLSTFATAIFLLTSHIVLAEPVFCPDITAAENGSTADQYYLGKAYDEGYCDIEKNKHTAEKWYRAAASQQHALAAWELGETFFTGDGFPTNYPEAKKWYLIAAEKGHGLSQLRLGFLYAESHFEGLTTDYAEAEKWFLKAAKKNAGDARFRIGNFYDNYKKPRDDIKAFIWLKRAAEGGHRIAMFDLARMLKNGRPKIAKNPDKAVKWMTKAAESDVLQAQIALAKMYETGDSVEKNITEALKWTLIIARKPTASPFWINRAGDIFFDGWETVPKNYPMARRFYERSAQKGDQHALRRLGKMYMEGLGVKKDTNKAQEYLIKAQNR